MTARVDAIAPGRTDAAVRRRLDHRWTGPACAVLGTLGFSFKAILIKLAYAAPGAAPVGPVTLLSLRMLLSLPAFV